MADLLWQDAVVAVVGPALGRVPSFGPFVRILDVDRHPERLMRHMLIAPSDCGDRADERTDDGKALQNVEDQQTARLGFFFVPIPWIVSHGWPHSLSWHQAPFNALGVRLCAAMR
jgi:hypothetical protein